MLADPRHERHHAPDLLRGVDLFAVPRADAADVDDLGAFGHDLVDALLRRPVVVGRPSVVERVAGAVDDRHHQRRVRPEPVSAQPQLHAADLPSHLVGWLRRAVRPVMKPRESHGCSRAGHGEGEEKPLATFNV